MVACGHAAFPMTCQMWAHFVALIMPMSAAHNLTRLCVKIFSAGHGCEGPEMVSTCSCCRMQLHMLMLPDVKEKQKAFVLIDRSTISHSCGPTHVQHLCVCVHVSLSLSPSHTPSLCVVMCVYILSTGRWAKGI